MFEQIEEGYRKYEKHISKQVSIFSIIADLYKNNMLLPRFHEKYYKCILYHSDIVEAAERFTYNYLEDDVPSRIVYDTTILAQYFIDEIKDSDNYNKIIDSLYNLNFDFGEKIVCEMKDNVVQNIFKLFVKAKSKIIRGVYDEDYVSELEFFLEQERRLTLSCPQIYILIVDILVLKQEYDYIPILLEYNFEPHNIFYNYTSPTILYKMIKFAFTSTEGFLLFLITVIQCAKGCTNRLLDYVIRNDFRIFNKNDDADINGRDIREKAILFWQLMNEPKSFIQFKEKISDLSLYNIDYDEIYKEIWKEYQKNEKGLNDTQIKKIISNGKLSLNIENSTK